MIRRLAVAVGMSVGTVLLLAQPAPAQAPDAQGWWWVGGSPVGLAPPYVPADGLYVASNPSGPESVSALRFTLAGGGSAGTLTLQVAGDVRGTAVVGLCALTSEWKAVQGGALSAAPACDAKGATAPGTLAADKKSVSFPVGALVRDGKLDVGVVPGRDASGSSPTFQIAFAKPGSDALVPAASASEEAPGAGGGGFVDPGPSGSSPPPESTSFTPGGSFGSSPTTAFVPSPPDAPLLTNPTIAPSRPASSGQALSAPLAAGSRPSSGTDNGRWRIAGFAVLAGTALAYHRLSIMPARAPQSLVAFGRVSEDGL